jgi:23S rRNA G2069 N7-methylase RlmK/C1962 C5-methylase RlmI
MDELTVEEMLDDDPGAPCLTAALAAIRRTAAADGVELTVDLYGKIVNLRIDQAATRRRATDLAALVQRLAAEATAAAHTEALAALAASGLDCALLDNLRK